ncbi:hypothetical protein F1880_008182 [Penicillium rolfsii]|nr:hypothetical protein F1880_008182 [Penicillium rolfsii]
MALPTTLTYRDILRDHLPEELKKSPRGSKELKEHPRDSKELKDKRRNSIELYCLATNKAYQNPPCKCKIGQKHIDRIQDLLERPIAYLEGDKVKIDAVLEELASLRFHQGNQHDGVREKIKELVKEYRQKIDQHLEGRKWGGNRTVVPELAPMPEESLIEEKPLPSSQPSCAAVTVAIEADEVTYPVLPTSPTFVIENDEEVVRVESFKEPHPFPQAKDTLSYPILPSTNPSTPFPISNTFPSNPLLSLILNTLQQLFMGFISLVQVRLGHVPIETASGEIENKSVVDLKVLLGVRMATELLPVLLIIVLCGFYFHAWNILSSLLPSVFVSAVVFSLSRWYSPGTEIVV